MLYSKCLVRLLITGGVLTSFFVATEAIAQSGAPAGSCAMMMKHSLFAHSTALNASSPVNTMAIINFTAGTMSGIGLDVKFPTAAVPTYANGDPSGSFSGTFTVTTGPVSGFYKMVFPDNSYWNILPANSKNTYFITSPIDAGSAVCQSI